MTGKIRTYIILALLVLCQNIMAQNKTPTTDSPSQRDLGIFALPPFERAVRCIKYYEGWHDIKRNYPYIGWGHRILPHEKFRKSLTLQQADSLLRSDLRKLCTLFRKYGRDTLILAVLAYNVGPYKILGNGKFPKSRLLQKIEQGERNIRREYLDFADTKDARLPLSIGGDRQSCYCYTSHRSNNDEVNPNSLRYTTTFLPYRCLHI